MVANAQVPAGARQLGLFAAALVAYQGVRGIGAGDAQAATGNALELMRLQGALGIAVEPTLQAWALARDGVGELLGLLYLGLHLPVTAAFFVWLWHRRRAAYAPIRNVFLAANGLALVVYVLMPVAPPRLVTASGLVDVLQLRAGVDLHGGILSGLFNPYAAVPSMHVAYAVLIGLCTARLAGRAPLRLLAAAYPVLVAFLVIATGNHFVLDAVAGVAMLVGGVLVVAGAGLPWRIPRDGPRRPHRPGAAG